MSIKNLYSKIINAADSFAYTFLASVMFSTLYLIYNREYDKVAYRAE
jgi:hypothetical protein